MQSTFRRLQSNVSDVVRAIGSPIGSQQGSPRDLEMKEEVSRNSRSVSVSHTTESVTSPGVKKRRRSFMSKLVGKLSPITMKIKGKSDTSTDDEMSCESTSGSPSRSGTGRMSIGSIDRQSQSLHPIPELLRRPPSPSMSQRMEMLSSDEESEESINSMLSLCDEEEEDDIKLGCGSLDRLQLEEQVSVEVGDGTLPADCKMSDDADNKVDEDDEIDRHFRTIATDDATEADDGSDTLTVEHNGATITLEALLSMHMTKGRILTELKLLDEAKGLYTYIIGEIEALIKYHMLVNPQHIKAEMDYENALRLHRQHREAMTNQQRNGGSRRRMMRRDMGLMAMPAVPGNTPFRRLTRSIGLENYYAARGDIYFKFKDLPNALRDFSSAIKYGHTKKEMGIYYNLRGVCYHEMRDFDNAIRDYDNAVQR